MADLVVRNVDPRIVRALKARAGRKGISAEAEHRAILAEALGADVRRPFAEFLMTFPKIEGHDDVFERVQDSPRPRARRPRKATKSRVPR